MHSTKCKTISICKGQIADWKNITEGSMTELSHSLWFIARRDRPVGK
jgi:hypothetical protein